MSRAEKTPELRPCGGDKTKMKKNLNGSVRTTTALLQKTKRIEKMTKRKRKMKQKGTKSAKADIIIERRMMKKTDKKTKTVL